MNNPAEKSGIYASLREAIHNKKYGLHGILSKRFPTEEIAGVENESETDFTFSYSFDIGIGYNPDTKLTLGFIL